MRTPPVTLTVLDLPVGLSPVLLTGAEQISERALGSSEYPVAL